MHFKAFWLGIFLNMLHVKQKHFMTKVTIIIIASKENKPFHIFGRRHSRLVLSRTNAPIFGCTNFMEMKTSAFL